MGTVIGVGPIEDAINKLQDWQAQAADPALRNMDQFAMSVASSMKEIARRMEKLETKLNALAAIQDLAWQSAWLPTPKGGDGSGHVHSTDGSTIPKGTVPTLKGGYVFPTYL